MSGSGVIDLLQGCFRDALGDKLVTVDVTHWVDVLDDGVHERLGKGGLVKLVVTHLTVTNKVDNDIGSELLTILGSDAEGVGNIIH